MQQSLKLPKMKLYTVITTRIISGESQPLLRQLSTATAASSSVAQPNTVSKQFLFQKLYELGPTGGKVSDVVFRTMRSGQKVTKTVLIDCLKDLRKLGRYHHCLEILDWLEKGRYDYSCREYALRLHILCKLKGLDEVEEYFDAIPPDAKDHYTYGALLHCYSSELATDKALAVYKKMDEMGWASHVLVFNNLMNLYVKVGQPEKVPGLIAEMKNRKVPLNGHSYSFWIQSYRILGDLEGVERVFHEADEQACLKNDWVLYSNVSAVFIKFCQPEKAISVLQKQENFLDNSKNPYRAAYHHLISLYASVGELESVIRVWNKLTSKFKVINLLSYLSILQALSNLDDIKGLEKYFREWESSCKKYDDRLPAIVIGAYLRHNMLEEAEVLLKGATKKAEGIVCMPHVKFMNYYFEKGQTDSALKHMAVAVASNWKPLAEKLDPCFQHFKAEKDVDGAEKFYQLLKKSTPLDARAYLWLLQTYAAAGKTAPDMRERIKEDGVLITPEIEELLERVCPDFRARDLIQP